MSVEGAVASTDVEILRRTASGYHTTFEVLVARHEAAVLRLIRSIGRDDENAEDALQETFVAAWRAAADFRGTGSARAWLLGIARNVVSRHYRRRAGEPSEHVPIEDLGVEAGWGNEAPDCLSKRLEHRMYGLAHIPQRFRERLLRPRTVVRGLSLTGQDVAVCGLGAPFRRAPDRIRHYRPVPVSEESETRRLKEKRR